MSRATARRLHPSLAVREAIAREHSALAEWWSSETTTRGQTLKARAPRSAGYEAGTERALREERVLHRKYSLNPAQKSKTRIYKDI